jgi:GT2 family glycosyltransferase
LSAIHIGGPRPTVSVLVVNYNGMRFLDALLGSLVQAFRRYSAEVIVVDNASTDGSAAWLRARADICLIEPGYNTGFTGGNNLAAASARGRVLLLLNNDTVIAGPLDDLVDAALEPEVGAAGCRLRYGDGRLQHSIGLPHTPARIVLSWLGLERWPGAPALLRKVETDARCYDTVQHDVAWVSGACLATRRDLWRSLRGLDDRLFMYCEDVDYCRRVRRSGLAVRYLPSPIVTHFEGGGRAWVGVGALLRTVRA